MRADVDCLFMAIATKATNMKTGMMTKTGMGGPPAISFHGGGGDGDGGGGFQLEKGGGDGDGGGGFQLIARRSTRIKSERRSSCLPKKLVLNAQIHCRAPKYSEY